MGHEVEEPAKGSGKGRGEESFWARCRDTTPRDHRNMMRYLVVLALWAVVFTGANQLIKRGVLEGGPLTWLVVALPFVAGGLAMLAYGSYLGQADELQRLIQFQGLALGFGGTFFLFSGYQALERLGAPEADFSDVALVMAVLYTLGIFLGWRRYR